MWRRTAARTARTGSSATSFHNWRRACAASACVGSKLSRRLRDVDFHTGAYLGGYDNTTQSSTHARALALAAAEAASREDQPEGAGDAARAFEHVFIMRLDMALTRSTVWKSKFYGAFC